MRSSPIPWSRDVQPARWAAGLLGSATTSIDWVVPLVYDAYVRLEGPDTSDHPAQVVRHLIALLRRLEARPGSTVGGREVDQDGVRPSAVGTLDACWFAVADLYGWNGHDPLRSAPLILVSDEDAAEVRADPGTFLDARTSSGVPRGAGAERPPEPYPHPVVETGPRAYMLFPGPLEHAVTSLASADAPTHIPDLCWPADRAWFLGSDTDFPHLFLGGTRTLVDQVLEDPDLDATEVRPLVT